MGQGDECNGKNTINATTYLVVASGSPVVVDSDSVDG